MESSSRYSLCLASNKNIQHNSCEITALSGVFHITVYSMSLSLVNDGLPGREFQGDSNFKIRMLFQCLLDFTVAKRRHVWQLELFFLLIVILSFFLFAFLLLIMFIFKMPFHPCCSEISVISCQDEDLLWCNAR